MAALANHKSVAVFGAQREKLEVVYDFAKDAGATGALDVVTFSEKCIVMSACMKIDTLFASGGSATLSLGQSGDVAGVISAQAVADMTAGAVLFGSPTLDASHVVPAGGKLIQTIATAAFTAGKLRYQLEVMKF